MKDNLSSGEAFLLTKNSYLCFAIDTCTWNDTLGRGYTEEGRTRRCMGLWRYMPWRVIGKHRWYSRYPSLVGCLLTYCISICTVSQPWIFSWQSKHLGQTKRRLLDDSLVEDTAPIRGTINKKPQVPEVRRCTTYLMFGRFGSNYWVLCSFFTTGQTPPCIA